MRVRDITIFVKLAILCWPSMAGAHVSEQGFVLLLPTGVYTFAGVAVVALTVLAVFAVPDRWVRSAFGWRPRQLRSIGMRHILSSFAGTLALAGLVWLGFFGARDPLSNLMPLMFWTVGWVGLVSLSGLFSCLWTWVNPWIGLYRLIGAPRPVFQLPSGLGLWPAVGLLLGFGAFLLADIAPDDPARLARYVALYWGAMFIGLLLFGPRWLTHVELGHAILTSYGRLSMCARDPAGRGGPGWQIIAQTSPAGAGVFALALLAIGSFDGLNETFWWLGKIGVNPLEFPGRSAVILPTLIGLAISVVGLIAVFGLCIWLGLRIARVETAFRQAFGGLALCILPIALVYHVAHYLSSFLVTIQYTVAALSDPLARGDDLLGISPFRVTTGFFNTLDTVRLIWVTQAGLVVFGHVWSVLLAHRQALDLFGSGRRAGMATLPLSVFMVGYTFLGLWLLAAPRGA